MPTILHSALTGAEVHEPKGIGGAASGASYVADGAGSGTWTRPEPKDLAGQPAGRVYVSDGADSGDWRSLVYHGAGGMVFNSGTPPYSLSATTSNQVINPVLVPVDLVNFTYTNTPNMVFGFTGDADAITHIDFDATIRQSSGDPIVIEYAISVDGVIDESSRMAVTAVDAAWIPVSTHTSRLLTAGDEIEVVFRVSSSVTVNFASVKMSLTGAPR